MLETLEKPITQNHKYHLNNGLAVTIREITLADIDELDKFLNQLSEDSIYARYLSMGKKFYIEEEIHICTTEQGIRRAIVATIEEEERDLVIGMAEYDWVTENLAEVGIVVSDEFQGQGLGTILLDSLVSLARLDEIDTFCASIHPANDQILSFVYKCPYPVQKKLMYGAWEIQVDIR